MRTAYSPDQFLPWEHSSSWYQVFNSKTLWQLSSNGALLQTASQRQNGGRYFHLETSKMHAIHYYLLYKVIINNKQHVHRKVCIYWAVERGGLLRLLIGHMAVQWVDLTMIESWKHSQSFRRMAALRRHVVLLDWLHWPVVPTASTPMQLAYERHRASRFAGHIGNTSYENTTQCGVYETTDCSEIQNL